MIKTSSWSSSSCFKVKKCFIITVIVTTQHLYSSSVHPPILDYMIKPVLYYVLVGVVKPPIPPLYVDRGADDTKSGLSSPRDPWDDLEVAVNVVSSAESPLELPQVASLHPH